MQNFRRNLIYLGFTGLFCLAIGLLLWYLRVTESAWTSIIISLCIGWSINLTFILAEKIIDQYMPAYLVPIPLTAFGLTIGLLIAGSILFHEPLHFFTDNYLALIIGVFFSIVGVAIFSTHFNLLSARTELAKAEAQRQAQQKLLLETELKLLQAQIEPHFLFNTLSNIVGLIRQTPEAAEQSLLNLTTLLRSSLQSTRKAVVTLEEELDFVRAYLDIQSIRIAERLQYEFRPAGLLEEKSAQDSIRQLQLPPFLLQPIVENAIVHGIESSESGGQVIIEVSVRNNKLIITIADTGVGISEHAPSAENNDVSGTGLSNVRQRLHASYGDAANMTISENSPSGVVVRLSIPVNNDEH